MGFKERYLNEVDTTSIGANIQNVHQKTKAEGITSQSSTETSTSSPSSDTVALLISNNQKNMQISKTPNDIMKELNFSTKINQDAKKGV